jgi:hypothetical protein
VLSRRHRRREDDPKTLVAVLHTDNVLSIHGNTIDADLTRVTVPPSSTPQHDAVDHDLVGVPVAVRALPPGQGFITTLAVVPMYAINMIASVFSRMSEFPNTEAFIILRPLAGDERSIVQNDVWVDPQRLVSYRPSPSQRSALET